MEGIERMIAERRDWKRDLWRRRRVFVTGATGFLGSHLIRRLVELGARVGVLLRQGSDNQRIQDLLPSLDVIRGDLTDKQIVTHGVREFRASHIFHLAAYGVDCPVGEPAPYIQTNVVGTGHLLEASRQLALAAFVQLGTSAEYGGKGSPFSEDSVPMPSSPYGASKAASTLFALLYHRLYAMPVVILRPFQAYGPGQGAHLLIPHVIRCALVGEDVPLTSGEQVRDFIFVSDVIDAVLLAAEQPAAIGHIFNVGLGKGWRVREVAGRILDLAASSAELQLGALPNRVKEVVDLRADTRQASAVLGWQAKVGLEEGLTRTIEWYRRFLRPGVSSQAAIDTQ